MNQAGGRTPSGAAACRPGVPAFAFTCIAGAILFAEEWLFGAEVGPGLRLAFDACIAVAAGTALYLVLRARDSAARRDAERFRHITESYADFYWELDPERRITYIDGSGLARFGVAREMLLGRRPEELPGYEIIGMAPQELAALRESREAYRDLRVRYVGPDGAVRYLSASGDPMLGRGGRFQGFRGVTRDITLQVLAEQEREESERRFRNLTELSSDWYWELDEGLRFTILQGRGMEAFGIDPQSFLGRTRNASPSYELMDMSEEEFAALRAAHRSYREIRGRYRYADGSERYVAITGEPMFGQDGDFRGYRGITRDITQRTLAEQALKRSEERYRSVVTNMFEGLLIQNGEGHVLSVNPAACTMLELSEAQILQLDRHDARWEMFSEDGRLLPADAHPGRQCVRTGLPVLGRVVGMRRTGGGMLWLRVNSIPLDLGEEGARGTLSTFTDIASEREAARALAESEERFRLIVESAPNLLFFISEPSREHWYYTSPTVQDIWGYRGPMGAPGQTAFVRAVLRPDDNARFFDRARRETLGEALDIEYRIQHPWKGERWLRTRSVGVPQNNGEVRVYGVTEDITDRRRADEALRDLAETLEQRVAERTEDLLRTNRELESFAHSVSHDLRTPLRAINSFARLLSGSERSRLSAEGVHMLERIEANAVRMGELIDDVLEYSDARRRTLQPTLLDMSALAQQAWSGRAVLWPHADEAHVEIGALGRAWGDSAYILAVFKYLLDNALKFSADARPARIVVGARLGDGAVEFYVRDNGVGFDMAHSARLFGMFQRLHHEHEFPGTGVGLALVKRIVERHGGSVGAHSSPGRGAQFWFTLPNSP